MTVRLLKLAIVLLIVETSAAQPAPGEKWDLRKCVEYAIQNNISVKQADLQVRFAKLDLQQSKWAQYPAANFSTSWAASSGRNQDPTNFGLTTTSYLSNNYSLQASVDLFNWFTKKNTIAVRDLNMQATIIGADKAKDDISLNVAAAYLQILLSKEQANVASIQVLQTKSQLESTRKQVDVGKLPELNAAQLEAQLATDSANLISANSAVSQSLLMMKALLNMDAALAFDVVTPPIELVPVEPIASLQPDAVYALATANLPQQKVDDLNVRAAKKSVEVARGSMYPTLSMFGSLGTTYNSKANEIISKSLSNPPIGTVTVSGTPYNVFPLTPFESFNYGKMNYPDQLNQNFRQSIGISLSVPIFNSGNLRTGWQRSKLTLQQTQLTQEQNSLTLKQDIYKAYNDAITSLEKFNANKKAVDISEKVYDFAKKRYDLGLLSTYDLINSQNSLQTAKSQALYSQYDYVFKMKVLEFYRGQGLKL